MKQLKKEVADHYQVLKGHGVGEYHWNGNVVHLDRLGLPEAAHLVEQGFPYLVPVETAEPGEQKAESEKQKAVKIKVS